ncbi:MAG: hypothetical protein A4C66_09710 [Nitrospira sp. HN-bin3]|nr:MAG: hypothetical protein A4C66_09710 [Nitrospira sp. HN-bin3]
MTQCQFHVAFKRSMSIREPAHLKDALFGGCGVVGWADLRGAHMQLAQPDGRIVGINRHGI